MSRGYDPNAKLALLDQVGFKKFFRAKTWSEYNRQFFDGLAGKYDVLNGVLSFGTHRAVKKAAIEKIALPARANVLDVCTGSGDVALFLARRDPQAMITGIDASDNMLAIASRRARQMQLSNAAFVHMDALHLEYPDHTFDAVFISFGLRNLEDLSAGLREFKRVLKPGGVLVNLDMGKPVHPVARAVYAAYFERLIPFLGKHIFHRGEFNSFAYLPMSNRFFPQPAELARLFEETGFQNIRTHSYLFGAIAQQTGIA